MSDQSQGFSLRNRREGGGTATLNTWGANSDYGTLRSVMLGPIENYRWLGTSSVSKKTIRRGVPFDLDVAKAHNVYVIKRSMRPGYSGVENLLYYQDNCSLIFGDAKDVCEGMVTALKGGGH